MKKSLFIFLLAIITTASHSQTDKGIIINGVTWATANVGADSPEAHGNYFTFQEAKSACPKGWKLPSRDDIKSLKDTKSEWTTRTQMQTNGRRFGKNKNSIFLPAAGYDNNHGAFSIGKFGYYWCITERNKSNAHHLYFGIGKVNLGSNDKKNRYSVRCVKE